MATLDHSTAVASRVADWAAFLVKIEGSTVVEEPNGKYSRIGVSVSTREEAESLTLDDFIATVTRTNEEFYSAAGRYLPVESIEYFVLRDFYWLAGPKNAIKGLEAVRGGTSAIFYYTTYLVNLSKRAKFAQYREGWITRLRRLGRAYYNV